jgi:hypothetical protein
MIASPLAVATLPPNSNAPGGELWYVQRSCPKPALLASPSKRNAPVRPESGQPTSSLVPIARRLPSGKARR